MTILLVDDDDSIVMLWSRYLAIEGIDLRVAKNVAEAIGQMQKIPPPDLVLLDLILPPYGPIQTMEAVDELRQFNPNLKIIAVSGMDRDAIMKVIKGFAVDGMVCKRDTMSQAGLLSAIQPMIEKAQSGIAGSSKILSQLEEMICNLTK